MQYSVEVSDNFIKEAKRLIKKYRSLKHEIDELSVDLASNPTLGTPLGNDIYKIRISVKSKGRGKSGGARIMSLVKVVDSVVILFSIYNKGEKDSISDVEIKKLVEGL